MVDPVVGKEIDSSFLCVVHFLCGATISEKSKIHNMVTGDWFYGGIKVGKQGPEHRGYGFQFKQNVQGRFNEMVILSNVLKGVISLRMYSGAGELMRSK